MSRATRNWEVVYWRAKVLLDIDNKQCRSKCRLGHSGQEITQGRRDDYWVCPEIPIRRPRQSGGELRTIALVHKDNEGVSVIQDRRECQYARVSASMHIAVASCYEAPAVSAHSLLPICTNREQHRAKANSSSSPLKMELEMTMSPGRPYSIGQTKSSVHATRI